jgi:hypothetical protein
MFTMLRRTWIAILFAVPIVASSPGSLGAQRQPPLPPAELLARFASEEAAPSGPDGASSAITRVLVHHADYPADAVRSLMDGLEGLALHSNVPQVRQSAVGHLAIAGRITDPKPEPGMLGRLKQIYARTSHPDVRIAVASSLGGIAERRDAVAFLDRLARQDPASEDFPDAAMTALRALPGMGDEGRTALKSLHESQAVRDPEVRYSLSVLASKGYRIK